MAGLRGRMGACAVLEHEQPSCTRRWTGAITQARKLADLQKRETELLRLLLSIPRI
jgi:hypothetical protein